MIIADLAFAAWLVAMKPLAAVRRPYPQHVLYAAGTIRPNHRTQSQQDDDARAYYDEWKRSFLVEAGTLGDGRHLFRVTFGKKNPTVTVSEGQGYGMIIVAVMAGYDPRAQELFDGLWNFSRQHPSSIDPRLMGYRVPEQPETNHSAFDGDCDMAYALLLAASQWGNEGAIRYRDEAMQLIAAIRQSTIGSTSRLPTLGDWIRGDDPVHNEFTPRSSDFMSGHFRTFARMTGEPVWMQVVTATQGVIDSLQNNYSASSGLLPDFIFPTSPNDKTPKPAPPDFLEGRNDGDYFYNAGRDPWRLGTDALLNGDPISTVQTRKITQWARAATLGIPAQIRAGYRLDGTPLPGSDYFSIFFAAPLAVAAMTDASQQQWLNDLYDAVYTTHQDYYEDSVTLLCLLTLTGNMWSPDSEAAHSPRRRAVRH